MENKCSSGIKWGMKKYDTGFQVFPPNMHRWNASEQAIWTWKKLFISRLYTTNLDLPIIEWDHIIFQYLITLNILHNSRVNQGLLVYSYLWSLYNFNKSPVSPLGTCMVFHDKPGNCMLWGHVGILVHHLTITDTCNVKFLKLALYISLIHCNTPQDH